MNKGRFKNITKYENLLKNTYQQCGGDVLLSNFRYDIICESLQKFHDLGISKKHLEKWQNELPFIYSWNIEYDILRMNVNRRWKKIL